MRIKRFAVYLGVWGLLFILTVRIIEKHIRTKSKHKLHANALPKLANIRMYTVDQNVDLTRNDCANILAASSSNPIKDDAIRHMAFLKVHKAASSTLFNMFYRFGQQRDLTFIVPRYEHTLGDYTSMRKRRIYPPPGNKTYDLVCLHGIFEKEVYEAYLPNDTVYIASVREPVERFVSAFNYYRRVYELPYLGQIPGPNHLSNFVKDPTKYENEDIYFSVTNNRMALDFGFQPQLFNNISLFNEYLKILDKRFDLVVDTGNLSESLVLMKRLLGWSLKDVLYLSMNKSRFKSTPLSKKKSDAVRKFLKLDVILYEYFSERLQTKIKKADRSFKSEVANFKHVEKYVQEFCSRTLIFDMGERLVIGESRWNKRFEMDFCDCSYMMIEELPAVETLQKAMEKNLKQYGPNKEFFLSRPK